MTEQLELKATYDGVEIPPKAWAELALLRQVNSDLKQNLITIRNAALPDPNDWRAIDLDWLCKIIRKETEIVK